MVSDESAHEVFLKKTYAKNDDLGKAFEGERSLKQINPQVLPIQPPRLKTTYESFIRNSLSYKAPSINLCDRHTARGLA